ncbi:aryl-sulfate sulfotransferase [Tenacibaculum aquimarinum]|uniref:aryl-sulfate sulfotransferase n=1 Tax=Tenacibaculum aquimarinum TaxID=2910675 RepID=UPI00215F5CEC|nr:aryl-sulfate sulfotransferase [Tenacibaculum aquimarinum]
MKKQLLFLSIIFTTLIINAQNTIGTVDVTNDAYEGYTLFTTHKNTYLINNCGQVINKWESDFLPGNSVYLLPNGNLLRAGRNNGQSDIVFGGTGGNIELFNWEGEKIWSYSVNNNEQRQHHDVFPMPNGNILILIAEDWSGEDVINAGRDPLKISDNELLYNEKILEVKPIGNNQAEEIWEWNIKDHLVQDFDATKDNFGTVSEFQENWMSIL